MNRQGKGFLVVAYTLVFAALGILFCPVDRAETWGMLLIEKIKFGGVLGAMVGLLAGSVLAERERRKHSRF